MSVTTILGVDPGSRITGYGVVQINGTRATHIANGCIRVAELEVPERLREIFDELTRVILAYKPDQAAVEKIFMSRNPDSALKLGQARGTAIVACAKMALPVFEYSATQIKQAVVGRGHADKKQVQHMIKILLNLDSMPSPDAADALATALCHGNTQSGLVAIQGAKTVRAGRVR
ncbi:MAG: crossover junction endodeoxyribonuclease RuvC [Gammaproteobacteria bacterium]|jgi:crossover junction endodeoxyribonuclease RuvC